MTDCGLPNSCQTICHDLSRIYHGLFFSGCLCRPVMIPCLKTSLHLDNTPPVFVIKSDLSPSNEYLTVLGVHSSINSVLPCSFTHIFRRFSGGTQFVLELVDFPSLEPAPIPLGKFHFMWCLNVKLVVWCLATTSSTATKKPFTVLLALEPRFRSTHLVVRWFSYVHILSNPGIQTKAYEQTWHRVSEEISLSALIVTDLADQALYQTDMQLDVQLNLTCGAESYRFVINPPMDLSFPVLMTQLTKSHRLGSVSPLMTSLLRSICPCQQTWYARMSGCSALSLLDTLHNLFQSKLGAVEAKTTHSGRSVWFWISTGPLVGIAVRLRLNDADCDSVVLEARCSQKVQLNLLRQAISRCTDHLKLHTLSIEDCPDDQKCTYNAETARTTSIDTIRAKVSSSWTRLRPLADTLLLEVECLTNLVSGLIERTMHGRIIPIEEVLGLPDSSRVDLVQRASDWFTKVSAAHLSPVESTGASSDYLHCMLKTDTAFSHFCFCADTIG